MKAKKNGLPVFFSKYDKKLESKQEITLLVSLITVFFFSLIYFNTGIHTGGDDAGYVLRAMRLWKNGEFPTFQGEVYPIFLAPFYGLSNGNLIFLRLLSIPMFLGSIYFLFKSYKNSIQPLFFFILLLILSVNFYWLNYASLTYSEALYNLLQFSIIYIFGKRFIEEEVQLRDILLLSFLALLLLKTRSIGAGIYVAVFLYLLVEKRWKILLRFSLVSLAMIITWEMMVFLFVRQSGSHITSQLAGLFKVNPYDPVQGTADFSLIFQRLIFNFNEYISKHVLQFLALRGRGTLEASWILTLLVSLFAFVAGFINKSRNKIIRFTLIYLGISIMVVLLTPKMWSQARFLQPLIPLIFIVLFYELQLIANKGFKGIVLGLLILLFVLQSVHSILYAKDRFLDTMAYIEGDRHSGQTSDWKNYLLACEWVGENLDPVDGRVACRKPQIAALVSRQDNFYGIYNVPAYSCHTIRNTLLEDKNNFLTIDIEKFFAQPVPQSILDALQEGYTGGIWQNSGNTNYRLFSFRDQNVYERIVEADRKLGFLMPMGSLAAESNNYSVSFADSLLNQLKEEGVSYLLLANLRVYEEKRTDEVLSGVHNYMKTLEMKYPGMFEEIFTVGEETQEPASVYRINYAPEKKSLPVTLEKEGEHIVDSYASMCEWVLANTTGKIICSGKGDFDIASSGRFFVLSAVPAMPFSVFARLYTPGSNYLVINPDQFNDKELESELSSALLNSFYGFMYIGRHMYRLHEINSEAIFKRITNDPVVRKHIFTPDMLQALSQEEKSSLYAIEPTFMLLEMQKRDVQYIMEDNLIMENNQNIPKKLVYLISRKYPEAFEKVKENGRDDTDRVSLYKLNYQVLNR